MLIFEIFVSLWLNERDGCVTLQNPNFVTHRKSQTKSMGKESTMVLGKTKTYIAWCGGMQKSVPHTPTPHAHDYSLSKYHASYEWCFSPWGRDKMADISQTIYPNAFSWMKIYEFRFNISLNFVSKCQIINIPALVQIMARRIPGNKPFSEPMMVSFCSATFICKIGVMNASLFIRC